MITFNSAISKVITKVRGEKFDIDCNVPLSYIFAMLWSMVISLSYGMLLFGFGKRVFVHHTSKIKCKGKISFGKNFSVNRQCYIDALSKSGIRLGDNVSIGKFTTIECTGTLRDIGKGLIVGNRVGL